MQIKINQAGRVGEHALLNRGVKGGYGMQRIFFYVVSTTIMFFPMASSYAYEVWNLVHSEYHTPNWYCTYQLQGSTAYTTNVVTANSAETNFCPPSFIK